MKEWPGFFFLSCLDYDVPYPASIGIDNIRPRRKSATKRRSDESMCTEFKIEKMSKVQRRLPDQEAG
jgi:hypothetical protein